ncbi:hypothetical protein WJX72_009771 [[Myrmecia] bisecta]|uniref:SAM-dependent MTase RsmB/NOP-type domain-containing protein n=1 Tax=[Myrmecia] bisecta TaxID=41462 RepID=A0AAW1PC18_9CHLO
MCKKRGVSLKSLTLAPQNVAKAATHAVVCQTLKFLPVIQQLIAAVDLTGRHPQLTQATAAVLVYEVLFGEGVQSLGPAETAVLAAKAAVTKHLDRLLQAAGVVDARDLLAPASRQPESERPRHVRVNTIKMSVAEALQWLQCPPPAHRRLQSLGADVHVDDLLPDLLVFPPRTDLHAHPLVQNGSWVLQSKASCMPAHALAPESSWTVLDACAAPGNKTTHLAALLGPGFGKVLAFDKDARRLERLRAAATVAGAANVIAQQADFLALDLLAPEYGNVRGVLLDPSCSGSGTAFTRMDHLLPSHGSLGADALDPSFTDERVEALAQFQERALQHALVLPRLERLVYSTCSVYVRENEAVVKACLPFARQRGFSLVAPFPSWPRRGLPVLSEASCLVRTDPVLDGTDGFFVAVFERTAAST